MNTKERSRANNIKNWRKYGGLRLYVRLAILPKVRESIFVGKWKISFNATCVRIIASEEVNATERKKCQPIKRNIFCWTDFHVEANFQSPFTPFHVALLRRAQFFYLSHAFVTRDIVITLWMPITVFDWQAIVDALCKFYGMIIATGYNTMDPLPTDRLFSFKELA